MRPRTGRLDSNGGAAQVLLEEPVLNRCELYCPRIGSVVRRLGFRRDNTRKLGDCRRLPEISCREVEARTATSRNHLYDQNRVTAKLEKVIGNANSFQP